MRFYIFIEDFEGKFIEGSHLENIFDSYINELEKLIKILRISSIVTIIRTQDLISVNYNLEQLNNQLKKNYDSLIKYWLESEKIGINNSTYTSQTKVSRGWVFSHHRRPTPITRSKRTMVTRTQRISRG